MPWKNPSCKKCKGKTRKLKDSINNPKKWVYKCKYCGFEFEWWGHFPDRFRWS